MRMGATPHDHRSRLRPHRHPPGGTPTLALTNGALKRLEEIPPPGHRAQIDLTITDDFPLAQAIVIISAIPDAAVKESGA